MRNKFENNPIVSIIIPVFNSEHTIKRCLDSIIHQTFDNWELIIVDDGSFDNSGIICSEYALKDRRIKVYNQSNKGVGAARNLGLKVAVGEWILFVDSDDLICEDFFEYFVESSKECDLIIGQYKRFKGSTNHLEGKIIPNQKIVDVESLKCFYREYISYDVMKGPVAKFFRKTKLEDIQFNTDQKIGEDVVFVFKYLQKVMSVEVFQDAVYLYCKDGATSQEKYALPIDVSALYMYRVFDEYFKLDVHSKEFETNQFLFFMSLAQSAIGRNNSLWFLNPNVRKVWNLVKRSFPIGYQIRMGLHQYPYIAKIINVIKCQVNI